MNIDKLDSMMFAMKIMKKAETYNYRLVDFVIDTLDELKQESKIFVQGPAEIISDEDSDLGVNMLPDEEILGASISFQDINFSVKRTNLPEKGEFRSH